MMHIIAGKNIAARNTGNTNRFNSRDDDNVIATTSAITKRRVTRSMSREPSVPPPHSCVTVTAPVKFVRGLSMEIDGGHTLL